MTRIYQEWQQGDERARVCSDLLAKYELYAARLFADYEPLITPIEEVPKNFFARLDKWLRNYPADSDQWNAFKLVDNIFFVGRHELNELYRLAFEHVASDWLAEFEGLKFDDPQFSTKLAKARNETWFCPISDSLRINAFRHINHLSSPDYFPDWRSLAEFGNPDKVRAYIKKSKISHLVLVEDFVGTGKQVRSALDFVKAEISIPVLVLPLIICPKGDETLREFHDPRNHRYYSPVLRLSHDCMIPEAGAADESEVVIRNRALVESYRRLTSDTEPYGFQHTPAIGSLVVMHTNCPNNTINPIHVKKPNWLPLFPRSKRTKKA